MLSVTITGEVTLDETPGLQPGITVPVGEDNNDNDVAIANLPASFSNRLFAAPAAGLGLSNAFPTAIGVGKSADNYISATTVGTVASLGFSKADGTALPVYAGVAAGGVASGLNAGTGGAISFFADPVLGSRMVIGVDAANDKVLALFLDPNATLTSAKVWTVQFEPLNNPDATDFDDPVTASGLGVAAGISTEFDFSDLPSGQNLFGMIGDPTTGLIVIGKTAGNTINTSQGGGGTTIGVNNQMFDPGEGALFTFVKDPDEEFLGTELDPGEADVAANIQYDGGTLEVTSGFLNVVQRQGNGQLKMRLSAFDLSGAPQGAAYVTAVRGSKTPVNITEIKVNNTIVFSGSQASVEVNISAGATVSWKTSSGHDVVLVEGVSGKFDIGGFGTTQATLESAPLSGVRFEDDGPVIAGGGTALETLLVDESNLGTDDTIDAKDSSEFTSAFGQDGSGATSITYALKVTAGDSGLIDTDSEERVFLSLTGGVIEGRTETGNALVFTVTVDTNGIVTLDQKRALKHPTSDPDETLTLAGKYQVEATGTITDNDGDSDDAVVSIGGDLAFKDDGPTIGPIASSIVDFLSGETITKTLNGAVGNDPNADRYTIDSFTASVTTNGVEVRGVLSTNQQVVTYFADTSGDMIFGNAGDTAYYRLTLSQTGDGTYTFDVLVDPPPAETTFDFNDLPSGQNLFGMIGDPGTGLIVIGKAAGDTINTSQGGGGTTIGVNNQMFDPGEGALFTFVKDPDEEFLGTNLSPGEADVAANIQYDGGTLEVTSGFLNVVQRQGGGQLKMRLSAFNLAGSPQGAAYVTAVRGAKPAVNLTEVRVNGTIVFSGSQASVEININAGDTVSWTTSSGHDCVLVEGVSGKFDIGGFGTTQGNDTPDQKLDFVAKVVDGDGDFDTEGFSIGIDGTGDADDDLVSGVVV